MAAKVDDVPIVDVQNFWRHNLTSGKRAGHGRLGEPNAYGLGDMLHLSAAQIRRLVKAEIVY